jgi:anaerobic magnesium-protoporphyrin IX monomethyl ester cyclase
MRVLLIDINPFMAPVTPISLGNLGAVLQGEGHEVEVISLGGSSRFSPWGLAEHLKGQRPRLVGFGTYQENISHVLAIARIVKKALPESRVVLGGPQATFMPEAALSAMPEVDYLSRGEGELVIRAIADAVEEGAPERPIAGATSRTADGEFLTGSMPEVPKSLDDYASPWLTGVLDPSSMDESILLTSRGCFSNCRFCYTPAAFGRKIRSQSVERVLEDITYVSKKGTGRLWFADPNFSFSERRVVEILEGILSRGLDVSMWIETRADMLTPGLIDLMKRAGVASIAMGLESASPNVYPALNKGIDPDTIGQAARSALAAGLDVELFSQFALPNETREDALETLRFVKDCGVKIRGNSNAQQMQLYFGAELTSKHRECGIRPLRDDLPPYLAIGAAFETEWMSEEEIKRVKSAWRAESLDGGKRVVS